MNTSDQHPDGGTQAFEQTKLTDPLIGRVLDGRYQIERLLGMGGMGAVYLANHTGVGKPVAVKIMHAQFMLDERTTQRFRHEVKAMSSLSHPNLISIMDAGTTDFGSPYFVMEYLPSRSLAEIIQDEVFLTPERAKPILVQIADALAHAHEMNIIHRDLKPANILVIASGNRDHVKVVDLGVAKLIGGDEGAMMKLTRTGEVFGSPLYMAPEQVLGRAHDGRTDLYQLGCVMFEMLTGVPPLVKASAIMTMNSHVQDPAPKFNDVMPDLPMDGEMPEMQAIVLKCLEKDPAARFQNMREFMHAIEHGLAPNVVEEPKKSTLEDRQNIQIAAVESRIAAAQNAQNEQIAAARSQQIVSAPAPDGDQKRKIMLFSAIGVIALALIVAVVMFVLSLMNGSGGSVSQNQQAQSVAVSGQPVFEKFNVEFSPVKKDKADLRVVSVYEGQLTPEEAKKTAEREGTVDVNVAIEGKPVILVVNAYMPTTWTVIKANKRVNIKHVYAVGFFPQQVKGVPPKMVTQVYNENFNPDGSKAEKPVRKNKFDEFWYLHNTGDQNVQSSSTFERMQEDLELETKCHLRSFQGTHQVGKFEVR